MQSNCPRTNNVSSRSINDESFPKELRLLKRSEFVRVQRRGKKFETRSLLLLVLPGKKGVTRLGITVSRKVGNSVKRNRIKRTIREVFRKNKSNFFRSADIVVVPKRVEHQMTYTGLLDEIKNIALKRK